MAVNPEQALYIGGVGVGQGKETFLQTLLPYLDSKHNNVQIVRPQSEDMLTFGVWEGLKILYLASRKPGIMQHAVSSIRGNAGKENVVTKLANRHILQKAGPDSTVVTVHGLWGKGLPHRFFAEGDVYPEPLAADAQTTSFVPLERTKQALQAMGSPKEIEVVGFLVPAQLQDDKRAEARKETFALGAPDREKPLRIAYMLTGQLAHLDYLHDRILGDVHIPRWIREGRAVLDVYVWNGKRKAKGIRDHARHLGLGAQMTTSYDPESYGVQVFYNSLPENAVDGSFAMAHAADVLFTPPAERTGWLSEVPAILLPPVGGNRKMSANGAWAVETGLAGPANELEAPGETLLVQLAHPGSRLRTHYDRVGDVINSGVSFNGAETIVNRILASTG